MNVQHRAHVVAAARGDLAEFGLGFVQLRVAHVQRAVRALDAGDAACVEAATLQALGVDAARPRIFFLRHHQERRHVAVDERTHADQLGYASPADLTDLYPKFYWSSVSAHIQSAIRYLNVTSNGRRWIANLHSNIFRAERELNLSGPQR